MQAEICENGVNRKNANSNLNNRSIMAALPMHKDFQKFIGIIVGMQFLTKSTQKSAPLAKHYGTAPTHPINLLHHPKTVPAPLTNTMTLLQHTLSSSCTNSKQFQQRSKTPRHCSNTPHQVVESPPSSSSSSHKHHGIALPQPIRLLHHCQTAPIALSNTMALLQHTPSSRCITIKQLHQRSQTPWHRPITPASISQMVVVWLVHCS